MFAYCLNNPVNGCDPCGTCFHQLKFWNDCEKCGGKTFGEKLGEYATSLYDAHMMQNEWQQQIDQMSLNAMRDSTVAVCDAIVEGIENQNKAQQQEMQAFYSVFIEPNPQKAVETARSTALVTSVTFAVSFVFAIPTSGSSLAAAAAVAGGKAMEAGIIHFAIAILSD